MLAQSMLIWILGLAALIVGFIANLKLVGVGAAALFFGIMCIMIYFLVYQIECLISGRCYATSWINTLVYLISVSAILMCYYVGLRKGELPSLSKQDLFQLSTTFQTSRDLIKTNYNVDITDYLDKLQSPNRR